MVGMLFALSIPLYMIWWKLDDILIELRMINSKER